ncbi:MAG: DNA polymerase I [Bacteroidaceae bacterium]|nr:DNA polymerase I [Bacteroidaceae bacterium]
MRKLILLDAYALIYRAYYALIRSPRINSKRMNTSAIFGFVNTLEEVLKRENPDFIGVAFDPKGGTFRHEIYPEYKAQRQETPEDIRIAIPYIKRILEAYRIPVLEIPGYEADDVIGTLATQAAGKGDIMTYMMTPDKDYGQLVKDNVKMLRPRHGSNDFEILGPQEICEKYGIQSPLQVIDLLGLMGDASDNVPGCPGVGEKTAVKLIGDFGGIEQLIARSSELKGALKQKVEDNMEGIRFSKLLVTIKTDVPITLDLDLLSRKPIDMERLRSLFEELEFRSLLQRVIGGVAAAPAPAKPQKTPIPSSGQLDLFATYDTESHELNTTEPQKLQELADGFGDLFASTSLATLADTPHHYHLVNTDEAIALLVNTLMSAEVVCFDTETTSTEPMMAELVGLSFAVKEGEAYYVPVPADKTGAQHIVDQLKPVYECPSTLKVGQNMKYDIIVLANYGVRVQGPMFDTMIAHYILKPEMHHNMDLLAEVYLNYQTIHIDALIGPKGKTQKTMREVAPETVCDYAAEDADITLKLKAKLEAELKAEGLYQLFETVEMPLVPVLAQMELNGVSIDVNSLAETSKEFSAKMNDIEREVYDLAGVEFNISSPKQVGEVLFDRLKIVEKAKKTKTGQYVTSEEVLQGLKGKHIIVEKILDYRGYKKLLSTYIDTLPQLINPQTGHIHTSYNQAVTATGRLSSSNPNLQNIPVRDDNGKEVRKAFIPDKGCLFFSADYSQIELRIMAHLSGDHNMIEAFNTGYDIHAATAAKIFKKPIEEVASDERRKAKTANFGIIYGITTFGLAERMQVSRGEAKELIDEYFATYPKVKEYMEKSVAMAREKGYTETLFGRRCHLPDINSHNAVVRGYAERNAINAPIQGTAADIIKVAMVRIQQRLWNEHLRSQMILQVHDELNFNVVPEEKEVIEQLVVEEMEHAFKMSVPLEADSGWGANWLEAH